MRNRYFPTNRWCCPNPLALRNHGPFKCSNYCFNYPVNVAAGLPNKEYNYKAPPFIDCCVKPRNWHGFVLLWSQHFKSFQANSGQSILRSASLWKQPVPPFAKVGQRHCTWDESVLFNVPPVKWNETTWPPCLASVSSSRSGDSSVQITVDFVNFCRHAASLEILAEGLPKHGNGFQDNQTHFDTNLMYYFFIIS